MITTRRTTTRTTFVALGDPYPGPKTYGIMVGSVAQLALRDCSSVSVAALMTL